MMILINLHPNKKAKTKENPGIVFLFGAFVLAAIAFIVIYVLANGIEKETKDLMRQKEDVDARAAQITEQISDVATIQQDIEGLRKRELVLARLMSIRKGPQFVLNEFGRLLTNPRDPMERKEVTSKGWTLAWEPDNVIIHSFAEIGEGGEIRITGIARSLDDVREFWSRMKTSELLRSVRLVEIRDSLDSATNENIQSFTFEMFANFNYQTKDGRDIVDKIVKDDASQDDTSSDESDSDAEGANGGADEGAKE